MVVQFNSEIHGTDISEIGGTDPSPNEWLDIPEIGGQAIPKYSVGQVVKFHTPLTDEDPNQLYVILEIKGDDASARVDIKALHTGLSFPPINTVKLDDLIIVELPTEELIGHDVSIIN